MMLIGLFLSFATHAAQPRCDRLFFRKACVESRAVAKDGVIQLSRGETLRLPETNNTPLTNEEMEKYQDLIMQQQAEVLGILESASKKVSMSDRFKMSFLSSGLWGLAAELNGGKLNGFPLALRFPMPPNDPKAEPRTLTKDEFNQIVASFPIEDQTRLNAVAKNFVEKAKPFLTAGPAVAGIATPAPVTEEKIKKANRIFSEAKENLAQSILRGRSESQLSAGEKSLLQRIQSVVLNRPDGSSSSSCNGDLNASYLPHRHQIYLCEAYYDQPESQIAFVLGHEIGHSLDPCHSAGALYTDEGGKQFTDGKMNDLKSLKIFAAGIPEGRHPLEATKKCLTTRRQIRAFSKSDLETVAGMEALYTKYDQLMSEKDYEEYRKRLTEDYVRQRECAVSGYMNTDVNEAMADVYGFVALEAHLRSQPPQSKQDAVAAIPFVEKFCDPNHPRPPTPPELKYAEVHQDTSLRVDLAAQCPSLAKGLGCAPIVGAYCENELLSYAAKMATPAQSTPVSSEAAPASAK